MTMKKKKCSIKYQYAAFLNFLCHRESNNKKSISLKIRQLIDYLSLNDKKLKIPGHFSYFGFFTEFSGTNIKFHGIPAFHRMWSP